MNYASPWVDAVTEYTAASMNPALQALDRAITYLKNIIIHCDGEVTYNESTGQLAWSSTLRINFCSTGGTAVYNTLATGNVTPGAGEFVYVDLNNTSGSVVTAAATGLTGDHKAYNRIVFGVRNSVTNGFYPVYLHPRIISGAVADLLNGTEINAATAGTSMSINWSSGDSRYATLATGTTNIRMTNPRNGHVYRLRLTQDATGSRLVSWKDSINWRGGTTPTLTVTANKSDFITLVYSNGAWYADASLNF